MPTIIFASSGSFVDVGVFEKDVGVRGFRVKIINLSGIEVLDWWDDELFRRVKDRKNRQGVHGNCRVTSVFHTLSKISLVIRRVWFERTPARQHRTCQDGDVECVPLHRGCTDHPQHVHAVGLGAARISQVCVSIDTDAREKSLDSCDVFVGNINGENRSLADFMMSGVRASAVVCPEESVSRTWPLEAIANPKSLRRFEG